MAMALIRINQRALDGLVKDAKISPRKRKNLNLHKNAEEQVQRMLNALELETYVRPHRHPALHPEVFLALEGRAALLEFNDDGSAKEYCVLNARGDVRGAESTPETWHTLVALDPGTVLFIIEPGPYDPETAKEFAPWAPTEESGGGPAFNKKILDTLNIR